MNSKFLIICLLICISTASFAQKIFPTNESQLTISVNGKILTKWYINKDLNPDIFELECKKRINKVSFSDGKDSIVFKVAKGQTIDFVVLKSNTDTAHTRIIGVEPNTNFTRKYINKYQGKTFVEIPEVSELVNIIMVLHKDAEKDNNMFDTKTEYYKRVKQYFEPFKNHRVVDTIEKYITGLYLMKDLNAYLFSDESYGYYYALKMNACSYYFDSNNKIKNSGYVREMAKGWNTLNPMKDLALFEDFALKSNFRKFYSDNKPYYESLITTYNQLNPISKMQNWLDSKFGFGYGSYVVYFSPLINGAHSTQRLQEDKFSQTFMFIARAESNTKLSPIMNELLESRVVFTEIDHNYVNPVTDKFIEKVDKTFSNREIWVKNEFATSYNSPYMVFNEYMTFGVFSLYVNDNYSNEDLLAFLPRMENQMEKMRGFIKFKDFNRTLLEKYQQNLSIKMTDLYEYMFEWASRENDK